MSSITRFKPEPGQLAYYRLSWLGADHDEPPIIWYEVDHDGCVLRLIEVFFDGRVRRDTMANYPDGASEFGFGTLIGDDFYDLEWPWPAPDDADPVVTVDATAAEFHALWAGLSA